MCKLQYCLLLKLSCLHQRQVGGPNGHFRDLFRTHIISATVYFQPIIEDVLFSFPNLILEFYYPSSWHLNVFFLQITSTLTFAAACASAGITVLIDNDLDSCSKNHCVQFETATAMAFISWFTALPSFIMNFWSLASRWIWLWNLKDMFTLLITPSASLLLFLPVLWYMMLHCKCPEIESCNASV